jgi:uncharacterized coiled-coil DUF342 family protein
VASGRSEVSVSEINCYDDEELNEYALRLRTKEYRATIQSLRAERDQLRAVVSHEMRISGITMVQRDEAVSERDAALARVAELEAALKDVMVAVADGDKACRHPYDCLCAYEKARAALRKGSGE